jgi:two-component system, OmpR family, response regulator BaeR
MTTNPPPLLIAEDDDKLADMLANYLRAHDFPVQVIADGSQVVAQVRRAAPQAVLLDVSLPGQDGLALCRELRSFSDVPIMMITASVDEVDRVLGLELGADDYVCKPFSPREVLARLRAQLRRAQGCMVRSAAPSGLVVDEHSRRVYWRGQCLALTTAEYRLLLPLLSRPEQVFSRQSLLEATHDDWPETTDRAIDSHVKNLRRKMNDAGVTGVRIQSVYGAGYRLAVDAVLSARASQPARSSSD